MISLKKKRVKILNSGARKAVLARNYFSRRNNFGLIFYTTYVEALSDNVAAIWAAFVYNMSYIGPEAILTLILLAVPAVRTALNKVKTMAVS